MSQLSTNSTPSGYNGGMQSMGPVTLMLEALSSRGVDLQAWVLAWARLLPTLTLVPAFGAKLLPAPARVVLALAMAVILMPTVASGTSVGQQPLAWAFAREFLRGLPIALSAAGLLWAAMMAGGLVDDLRGASNAQATVFSDAPTPLSTLLGLYAAFAFLHLGGAERVVERLMAPVDPASPLLLSVALELAAAVGIAVSLAAPVLSAVIVWEVTSALITRAASPAHMQQTLVPVRALVALFALTFSLDGMLGLISRLLAS